MPNSMHVLHIVEDFVPLDKASGGAPISIRNQIEQLASHCTVSVLAPRLVFPPIGRYRDRTTPSVEERERADPAGIEVYRPPYLHVPVLWVLTEPIQLVIITLWFVLRRLNSVQIIHGHRMYPMGIAAVLSAKLTGRLSIVTAHGSDVHTSALRGDWRVRAWTRLAIRLADLVIAVSRELVGILTTLGVEADRRCYVPNGVDLGHFQPRDRSSARRRLGIAEDASVFVCVALFAPVKGHSILIEAFREVSSRHERSQLVLIGDGEVRSAIEEQVRAAGMESRVRFTGNVDHRLVPEWLAASDAFVLPSLNEGTPLSALEALAAGRPVVGTAVGGTPEVVCNEDLGFIVPPGDPAALAAAMLSTLERSWDSNQLRERAKDFAWPKLAADILSAYEGLILER